MPRPALRMRGLLAPVVLLSSMLAACEQADPTEPTMARRDGFELAAYLTPTDGTAACGMGARRTKVIPVTVTGHDGVTLVEGAVVTLIDPNVKGGSRCWGVTDEWGVVEVTVPADGYRFLTVRSEVSPDAPRLEIVPPAPPEDDIDLAWNPAVGTLRHSPSLIYGRRCDVVSGFSWGLLSSAASDPCRLSQVNSIAVTLAEEENVIYPQINGLNGEGLNGVIIAAVSAAAGQSGAFNEADVNTACGAYAFIDFDECKWPKSHGPAFVYAMTLTENGLPPSGLAVGPGPIWIEAIAPLNDGTSLFGTIENYSSQLISLEPGICKVGTRTESVESAALDIQTVKFGVGLKFVEAGVEEPTYDTRTALLQGVPNSLIVKLGIKANAASTGTLTYTLRYQGNNASRSVNVDFEINPSAGNPADVCKATAWYGNGLDVGAPQKDMWCSPLGDGMYSLVFQVYELNKLQSASFSVKTNPGGGFSGDALDADKSDLSSASQPFDLKDLECPLQLNTDGRLIGIG